MKKILSLAITLVLGLNVLIPVTRAASETPDFLESVANLQGLKGYKLKQSVSGEFNVKDAAKGKYSLTFPGAADQLAPYQTNSNNKVKLEVSLEALGEGKKEFESAKAQVRGEIITMNTEGVYLKLDGVTLDVKGLSKNDQADYREFRKEMDAQLNDYKNKWFYLPLEKLQQDLSGDQQIPAELNPEALQKTLAEKGLRGALEEWITVAAEQEQGALSDEDKEKMRGVLDTVFETKIFATRSIRAGKNKGQTAFNLNKSAIMSAMVQLGKKIGEPLSASDLSDMREAFSHFDLSGSYKVNAEFGLYEALNLRLTLKNIEELTALTMNFQSVYSDLNKTQNVSAPKDFTELDTQTLFPGFSEGFESNYNFSWIGYPFELAMEGGTQPKAQKDYVWENLPDLSVAEVDKAQKGMTFSWGDLLFQFVLQPNASVSLPDLRSYNEKGQLVKYAGVLVSGDSGYSWNDFFQVPVAQSWNELSGDLRGALKYNPLNLFVKDDKLYVDIANDAGGEPGEGALLRFATTDGENWEKAGCYNFKPNQYYVNGKNADDGTTPWAIEKWGMENCAYAR